MFLTILKVLGWIALGLYGLISLGFSVLFIVMMIETSDLD